MTSQTTTAIRPNSAPSRSWTWAPKARRWTVRAGTDGIGLDLFEVYAVTMDEARQSVLDLVEETGHEALTLLPIGGFTVHAEAQAKNAALQFNLFGHVIPAPDWADWNTPGYGPLAHEVRLDTADGLVDALLVADDGPEDMVLLLVDGQLQEHPVQALHPRCECGNPYSLCHPEA